MTTNNFHFRIGNDTEQFARRSTIPATFRYLIADSGRHGERRVCNRRYGALGLLRSAGRPDGPDPLHAHVTRLRQVFLTKLSTHRIVFLLKLRYTVFMSADTSTIELAAIASDPTAAGIRANLTLLDRGLASIIADLDRFDQGLGWGIDGAPSLVSWLCSDGRRTRGEASRMVKVMRVLRSLPVTQTAFADGTLAAAQTAVIAANVTDTTIDLFADAEAELVPLLADLSVDQTGRVVKEWSQRAKASLGEDGAEPEPEHDRVHFSPMLDNTWKLDGILAGENAKTVDTALDACLPELIPGEPVLPASQRYAAALVEMARRSMQHVSPSARRSIDMTVLIDWQDYVNGGVARYTDDTTLAPDRVRRLLCDAKLNFIQLGEHGEPLWMSRSVRTATPRQWRALIARDRHCAFPGCTTKPSRCEAHHIREYDRDQGPTDIDNMGLLCSRHHTLVHKPGWTMTMQADQRLQVVTPDGRVLRGPPPSLRLRPTG